MAEAVVEAKERPIKQGDDGDFLFAIEVGKRECHAKNTDGDGETMVKTVEADDAAGELTLFYNCPLAARGRREVHPVEAGPGLLQQRRRGRRAEQA